MSFGGDLVGDGGTVGWDIPLIRTLLTGRLCDQTVLVSPTLIAQCGCHFLVGIHLDKGYRFEDIRPDTYFHARTFYIYGTVGKTESLFEVLCERIPLHM